MKRIFVLILMLAMLLPMALSAGTVAKAEDYTAKPFYGAGWSDINRIKFQNLEGLATVSVKDMGDGTLGLTYAGKSDPKLIAESVKKFMDRTPEGMRHLFLAGTAKAFSVAPEDAIFMENGIGQLKALFTEFIDEYKRLGGKLDSLVLDTEYVYMSSWYLYSKFYGPLYTPTHPTIYKEIIENPKYATMIRPLLVERGFVFYDNPSGNKSEIASAFPYRYLSTFLGTKDVAKYANSASVWDTVMSIHLANYLNGALLDPLLACYPNAIMSDYQEDDVDAWQKSLSDTGGIRGYYGGNGIKVGNASNYNTYSSRPSGTFYKDGDSYVYQNLPAFNNAVYEDDPYHMFLFDANKFKQMYAATDNKKITAWIAEYDYSTRAGSVSNTPYYTETLYHIGMLNPESFLLYIYAGDSKFKGTNGTAEYNKRMQTVSEILYELTRVAGFSDRQPIETPINWNDGFVLSGMYAGGRNIWRITPDTTEGTSLEAFKVAGEVPTFSINGTTVVFPQGRVISDSNVSVVGSAGYWVETPKNVNPVITRDADRYSAYPSFLEDFSDYADGTVFNSTNALPLQTWDVSASKDLQIRNKALSLTGTAVLNNVKLPQNITAGDSYAKEQAWEVSFTLSSALNSGASVKLLTCGTDGGVKLEGSKVYYDQNGEYKELSGVTLSSGEKYTVKREVNFTNVTCTYSLYKGTILVKQAANIPMKAVALPVASIGIACDNLEVEVSLDDYKLYPTGLAQDFEIYNADSGIRLDAAAKNSVSRVAYRLSWLNGTDTARKVNVKAAQYNSAGSLLSEKIISTVEMAPGCDGVETGTVQNTGGKVLVYLEDAGTYTPDELPDYDDDFEWGSEPTAPPATQPTALPDLPDEPMPTAPPSQPVETEPSVEITMPTASQPTAGPNQTTATKAPIGNQGTSTKATKETEATRATAGNQSVTKATTGNQSTTIKVTKPNKATKATAGNQGTTTKATVVIKATKPTKATTGSQGAATKGTTNQGASVKPTYGNQTVIKPSTKPIYGIEITRPTQGVSGPSGGYNDPSILPSEEYDGPSAAPTEEYDGPSAAPTDEYDDLSTVYTGEYEELPVIPTEENGQEASPTEPDGSVDETKSTKPVGNENTEDLDEEPQVENGLSGGTIALIVVGALLVAGGVAAGIVFWLKKKKAAKPAEE